MDEFNNVGFLTVEAVEPGAAGPAVPGLPAPTQAPRRHHNRSRAGARPSRVGRMLT